MFDQNERKPVVAEIATAEKDLDLFSGWTGRMENPDAVLRSESMGRGVRLYEELERDWQVFAQLQVRTLALQSCEWQIEPAGPRRQERKEADLVERVLRDANFDQLCKDLMQAVLTGYKPVEIMWQMSGGEIRVRDFRGRRPSRFSFDMAGDLRLLTVENPYDGEPVPERKFIVWTFGGHDACPYGRGLGYQLYWPVWFKKNGVKFWMVFAEKFGSPTVVGKYPAGTSESDKNRLLDAIAAVQQETGIRIPDNMCIELLEAARTGAVTYEDLCNYFDRAISKVLLGQTLTSEPGASGSYSLGQVHDEVRRDLLKSDADSMSEVLNRSLIRWLVDYNFPSEARSGYPRVWRRTDPESDLKVLADRDKVLLVDMGMANRVPESYISDTYGIPLAQPGDRVIGLPQRTQPGAGGPPPSFAEPGGADFGQAALDRMTDAATVAGQHAVDAHIKPVLELVEKADSLEGIARRLYELYPDLDRARLQELLAKAMFMSAAAGYASAARGGGDV